ncbi:MAG TPA: nucleotidyltransferase domain-containing protein [Xanthobacteraceae bacterium]|jgi:predicted nucleotidyltransferase
MRTLGQSALENHERTAIEAAARLLRERFAALEVVLFGSRARGEGDAESDLDLLVLTARPLDWRERQALIDALFEIELTYDVVLSPLIVMRDAWQHGPYSALPIHAEVERDGVAV